MISSVYVPPSGPEDADILIIGDHPYSDDVRLKQPFVGASGNILRQLLRNNNIFCATADEPIGANLNYRVRFMNLCNYQPLKSAEGKINDFKTLLDTRQLQDGVKSINEYIQRNHDRLKLIIVLGEYPLQYICGKYGIFKWRGSVVRTHNVPVIACYHPEYITRVGKDYPVIAQDISKGARVYKEGYKSPSFQFTIDPQGLEFEEILHEFKSASRLALDIETVKYTNNIICIGVASSRSRAVCIPNRGGDSLDTSIRRFLSEITEGDGGPELILHNGIFDLEILHNNYIDIPLEKFKFDTIIAQHVMAPELEKGLDFITAIYTDIPYYKDRGRAALPENEKGWGKLSAEDKLNVYEYNCLDCVSTFWCWEGMNPEIKENSNFKHIFEYEMDMHEVAFDLIRNGLPWDTERKDQIKQLVEAKYVEDGKLLLACVGHYVNVGSHVAKKKLFYETWGLPTRMNKDSKVSADEDAIVGLISYVKDHLSTLVSEKGKFEWQKKLMGLMLVLRLVGYRKLLGSYIDIDAYQDGRMRSFYKIPGTETGRWACTKYLDDSGLNSTTMPRESFGE